MLWSSEEILKPDDREEGEKKVNLYINYLFFFFFSLKKTMEHRNVEIIIIKNLLIRHFWYKQS